MKRTAQLLGTVVSSATRRGPGLVLAGILLGLLSSCGGSPSGEAAVDRVVLLGLDGLEWGVLEPLLERGQMPHLKRFIDGGARGSLSTLLPTYSPIIWASIITGKGPAQHGIDNFFRAVPDASGVTRRVPYTSNSRRAKALWTILSEAGRRVASVGWWSSWPAEEVTGILVSDRLVRNRFDEWIEDWRSGEGIKAQTWPRELFAEIAPLLAASAPGEEETLAAFAPLVRGGISSNDLHDPLHELHLVHVRDRVYLEVLDHVLQRERPDFLAFYLNGIDIASHYFWKYRFPDQWKAVTGETVGEDDGQCYHDVIDRYCAFVDRSIAPLLALASERCLVIVVSDHGFRAGRRSDSPNISGTHWDSRPPGVILAAGGPVPKGGVIEGASVLDVTPTILHALGLEVGRDMDGRALEVIAGTAPVRSRSTWEGAPRPEESYLPISTLRDDEIMRKLEALGYVAPEKK